MISRRFFQLVVLAAAVLLVVNSALADQGGHLYEAGPTREAKPATTIPSHRSEVRAVADDTERFALRDGSVVTVDYESMRVTIGMGRRGPQMNEAFVEDDFGGIYWDWGQVVPREDGSWFYEDWLGEGYKSVAIPIRSL